MNNSTTYTLRLCSLILLFSFFQNTNNYGQVSYTANDQVTPYNGTFRAGYNIGFHPGWTDQTLADLAAGNPALGIDGAGAKATRQGLFYGLFDAWGYTVRVAEMQHYKGLGMDEQTGLILGGDGGGAFPYPPMSVRDPMFYCPTNQSELFANLYDEIWDNNNGTPINENNYFADYMYKTVNTYKDYVRFWEIWNEPGFDYTGSKGWRLPGDPAGNWWDNDPDPCDYRLRAPIQHYVRMLRISWEVIKTLDPDAYVTCGAPGFPSFVDAILRNTDNPNEGVVTPAYPNKGGAYFDALAYHSYPHFDGSVVLDPFNQIYMRTSDQAAKGVVQYRDNLQEVLTTHGYDGGTYPKKEFIVTESNLPRQTFSDPTFFGNATAQRNFVMKAAINCKQNRIHQFHIYTLAENTTEANATYEFNLMGLYKNIDNQTAAQVEILPSGIGLRTVSTLLHDTYLDGFSAGLLQAPPGVRLEAFRDGAGKYIVALWAETMNDMSEAASANYVLPSGYNYGNIKLLKWNYSQTGTEESVQTDTNIQLNGAPSFLVFDELTTSTTHLNGFDRLSVYPNPSKAVSLLSFDLEKTQKVVIELHNALGQKVKTIHSGILGSGRQEFDITANKGLFFIKIQSEEGQVTRRVLFE